MPPAVAVRPAATVLVLRDSPAGPEVFMVRRHAATAFMGGAHVFPGGRVDDADRTPADAIWCDGLAAAAPLPGLTAADAAAHRVAAARELFEEAGVLLARDAAGAFVSLAAPEAHARFRQSRADVHGGALTLRQLLERERLRLAADAFVPCAHWVTPPVDVRRFDTWFFAARMPPGQSPAHDEAETTAGAWTTAAGALAQSRAGQMVLPPPTWTTLREIEPFRSVDDLLGWARRRTIVRREPRFFERDGRRLLVLPGDPLYPDTADGPFAETRFVMVAGAWRAQAAAPRDPS